jgi:hypothetical protein
VQSRRIQLDVIRYVSRGVLGDKIQQITVGCCSEISGIPLQDRRYVQFILFGIETKAAILVPEKLSRGFIQLAIQDF